MARLGNGLSIPRALYLFQRKRIPALCSAADVVGKCVHISGDVVGRNYQVRTAVPNDLATMPAVGVIVSKKSTTECLVWVFGEMTGTYSGLTPGRVMFVGDDGSLVAIPPVPPPGESVYVQSMGVSYGSSIVVVDPSFSMVKRIG